MSLESKHRKKYFSTFTPPGKNYASVAELVDALDSKSSSFGSVGSIPTRGTSYFHIKAYTAFLLQKNLIVSLILKIVIFIRFLFTRIWK